MNGSVLMLGHAFGRVLQMEVRVQPTASGVLTVFGKAVVLNLTTDYFHRVNCRK